jgi:hypothetical protein
LLSSGLQHTLHTIIWSAHDSDFFWTGANAAAAQLRSVAVQGLASKKQKPPFVRANWQSCQPMLAGSPLGVLFADTYC